MPHDSFHLRVQSLESEEGSLTLNELTVLCTTLSKKVEDLQSDMQQTKLTYGATYTKLTMRVNKLGRTSADTEILLDQEEPNELVEDLGSGENNEKEISTANIPVSTAGTELSTIIPEKKTKKQLEQERLRHEEAIRLQEQINEEERQMIARDAEIAKQSFSVAKVRKSMFGKKRIGAKLNEESAKRQKLKDVIEEAVAEYEKEKEELRLSLKIIHNDDSEADMRHYPENFLLLDKQDLNDLYSLVQERFQDHPLEGHDLLLWGDQKMIFDPDENDELWMNQMDWKLLRWKLHENCGVHTLFMDGAPMEINMLVEKKYHLINELLEKMLNLQLEIEEESTMAFELIKFIKSLLEN
nr:hypothetical protein [Tanacetum cinerariifolium]